MTHARIWKKALCACLALAALLTLAACQAASTPQSTLAQFEAAYNRLDMDALMECIEPVQAKALRSAMNLMAGLTGLGISGDDLLGVMPIFANLRANIGQGGQTVSLMPKLSIAATNYVISGDSATCAVSVTVTLAGQAQRVAGSCTFTRIQGRWYMQDMR